CLPKGITEDDAINGKMDSGPDLASASDSTGEQNATDAVRMRPGYMPDPRFGFSGTISGPTECAAAGGTFHNQIFGWMIHVYPFDSEDLNVAFGTQVPAVIGATGPSGSASK